MVSDSLGSLTSEWLLSKGAFLCQEEGLPEDFIGGRRLGTWEAVVFGEPYVESALSMVI
jgi:hypothetical protein